MKPALATLVVLAAVAGGVCAQTNEKPQASVAKDVRKKQEPATPRPVTPKDEPEFVPGGLPESFVIPSNTCEQGTPLQKLLRDKPQQSK